jgi:glutathione S-transferase
MIIIARGREWTLHSGEAHPYRRHAMRTKKLTLYVDAAFVSPYAMSAHVALSEKGLPFALETVDLSAKAQLRPAYQVLSLTARVPALVHGDFHLSESSAVAEYLEEAFPFPDNPRLYPADVRDRARARQVQAWLRSDLMPIREERPTSVVFSAPVATPLSEKARTAADKLFTAAEALLGKHSDHLFGQWCIADTDLALMLNRLVHNGDAVPDRLAAYAQSQWQRPSVQAWLQLGRHRSG